MSNINEWERGVDEEGGYYVEPETGTKYRFKQTVNIGRGIVYVNFGKGNAGPNLVSTSELGSKGQQVIEKDGIKVIQN